MSLTGLWRITHWAGFMIATAAVADSSLVALLFQSRKTSEVLVALQ